MPPLALDRSLVAHAFCFCPFALASTIPGHYVPWLAVRIALVAEAVAGFLLSVLAHILVYWFPALAPRKPPAAPPKQTRARPFKRRPKPAPIQTSNINTLPSDSKPVPKILAAPVALRSTTPVIVLTYERSPSTSSMPRLPTVVERPVASIPRSLPASPRSGSPHVSPTRTDAIRKHTASTHAQSIESEPAIEAAVKHRRKEAIEAFTRDRPVSLPPMARSQSMTPEKSASGSSATPRRNNTFNMRMRRSLISEPLRLLSLGHSPRLSEKECRSGKERKKEGEVEEKECEKEKDGQSKRPVARTDPYAAPFFFPSPASPDADQYTAALRERPMPMVPPVATPSLSTPTPLSLLPVTPIARGSTKGKRRFFGSHKRNKSDVVF